jgi:hypothetical protein
MLEREQQVRTKAAALRVVPHRLPQQQARDLDLALVAATKMQPYEQPEKAERDESVRR